MGHARSFVRRVSALVVGLTLLASGCAGGSPSDEGGAGGRDDTMIYGKTDGGTTFVHNYNVVGPAIDKAPNMELVYEPLMRIDYSNGAVVEPWLAESWEFDDAGTTLTVHLRDGVTFSDGEPFTADDAVYSLNLPIEQPEFSIAGVTYEKADEGRRPDTHRHVRRAGVRHGEAVRQHPAADGARARLARPGPQHVDQPRARRHRPVHPRRVQAPAGHAGRPGRLLGRRAADVDRTRSSPPARTPPRRSSCAGDIDIAQGSWANGEQEYTAKDPERNLYQLYPNGGAMSAMFNAGQGPVRRRRTCGARWP